MKSEILQTQQKASTNKKESKAITALIIASLTPATIFLTFVFFISVFDDYSETLLEILGNSIGAGFFVFAVAFIHTFVFGMPLFYLGSHLNLIRWWTILLGSFIVGSTPCAILSFLHKNALESYQEFSLADFEIIGFMGLCGLSGGIVFWILWRYWILEKPSNNFDETH